jgi:hypothetical protein
MKIISSTTVYDTRIITKIPNNHTYKIKISVKTQISFNIQYIYISYSIVMMMRDVYDVHHDYDA